MFEIIIYLPFAVSLIFGVLLALDYTSNYEVAVASGFSTTTAFYNAFRKVTGTTPKKWVQTARK